MQIKNKMSDDNKIENIDMRGIYIRTRFGTGEERRTAARAARRRWYYRNRGKVSEYGSKKRAEKKAQQAPSPLLIIEGDESVNKSVILIIEEDEPSEILLIEEDDSTNVSLDELVGDSKL